MAYTHENIQFSESVVKYNFINMKTMSKSNHASSPSQRRNRWMCFCTMVSYLVYWFYIT